MAGTGWPEGTPPEVVPLLDGIDEAFDTQSKALTALCAIFTETTATIGTLTAKIVQTLEARP